MLVLSMISGDRYSTDGREALFVLTYQKYKKAYFSCFMIIFKNR